MYISDKPNYPLIQTLLDSLYHDLRLLVDPPDGSKQHPASTCLELWLCHPNYTSGQSPPLSFKHLSVCSCSPLCCPLEISVLQLYFLVVVVFMVF